jgi:P27 family predicted phage terminase small subunit
MDFDNKTNGQQGRTPTIPLRKIQEPQPETLPDLSAIPPPPPELSGRSLDLYLELIPTLAGRIGPHDWLLVSCYCIEVSRYFEAVAAIERKGMVMTTSTGYEQQVPEIAIAKQSLASAKGIAEMFGFSPLSRKRITGPQNPKTRRKS